MSTPRGPELALASTSTLTESVERCIDGDLSRRERLELFANVVAKEDALDTVAAVVALEQQSAQLARAYEAVPVPDALWAAAQTAAGRPSRWFRLWDWCRMAVSGPTPRLAIAGLAGATIAVLLTLTVVQSGETGHALAPAAARLQPIDMPFSHVADTAEWTEHHRVEAGQSVRFEIRTGHKLPYRLRVRSASDLHIELVHSRAGNDDIGREVQGVAVHYAMLHGPRQGDVLVIHNRGGAVIDISLYSAQAGAVQARPHSGKAI